MVASVIIANVVALLMFLFALLHPAILNPFQVELHTAWRITALLFGASVLVANGIAHGRLWRLTPVDACVLVYVALVLATWPTSFDRSLTAAGILGLLAQLSVFAAMRVIAEQYPYLTRPVVAALIVGMAMLEWTAADVHLRLGLSVRMLDIPPLDWDGREGLALLAAIEFGLLLGIWQRARSAALQLGLLVLILGVVVQLLFLYARLAWVATAAAFATALLVSIRTGEFRRYLLATVVVGGFIGAIGTPYMIHLAKATVGVEHGAQVSPPGFRLAAWSDSLTVIRRHAIAGTGLGTYMSVRPRVDMPDSRFLPSGYPMPAHPHNAYLQQMAEVGIAGGAAYLAIWLVVLWAGWRASLADAVGGINLGLFLALVAIAVSNLGENMFEGTERLRLESIAWILAALVVSEWQRVRTPHQSRVEYVA